VSFADTWPPLQGLVHVGVPEQYLWSIFILVSAAVQNTWGDYNPVTWGEALVWTFAMVTVAVLFAVMVGFIVAAIRSSGRATAKYKERMDTVMVSLQTTVSPQYYHSIIIVLPQYYHSISSSAWTYPSPSCPACKAQVTLHCLWRKA